MGPTASGKSSLALELASRLDGEIINADSRQIYAGFDAATAKPAPADLRRVPHHLYDFLDPQEAFSAGSYARAAAPLIEQILKRKKVPVLAGGTGLYLRALLDGITELPGRDDSIRKTLLDYAEKFGRKALHERLEKADAASAKNIPHQNIQRVVRALEIFEATGKPLSLHHAESPKRSAAFSAEIFGIAWERAALKRRIGERCKQTARPLIEEARELSKKVPPDAPAFQGLGYRAALAAAAGDIKFDEFLASCIRDTERYAKRQMTWFRKDARIRWIPAQEPWDPAHAAGRIIRLLV